MSKLQIVLKGLFGTHGALEIFAVLVAGVGLGIGAGAIIVSHKGASKDAAESKPVQLAHTGTTHTTTQLPAASEGVQPGRSADGGPVLPTGAREVLTPQSKASFADLKARLAGKIELAAMPVDGIVEPQSLGGDIAMPGWSTTKVLVIATLLKVRGQSGLNSEEWGLVQSAITESSNEAIVELFHDLEGERGGFGGANAELQNMIEAGGDQNTSVATAKPPPGAVTTFGQTRWSPTEAVRFFSALAGECLELPRSESQRVLGLMQRIVPSESWGLGSAGFRRVAFKGGWGPEKGRYLVRQSGIVEVGTRRAVAVAIVDLAPSFAAGQEELTETARWLKEHLVRQAQPATGCAVG